MIYHHITEKSIAALDRVEDVLVCRNWSKNIILEIEPSEAIEIAERLFVHVGEKMSNSDLWLVLHHLRDEGQLFYKSDRSRRL